jgi:hypothetical protein
VKTSRAGDFENRVHTTRTGRLARLIVISTLSFALAGELSVTGWRSPLCPTKGLDSMFRGARWNQANC